MDRDLSPDLASLDNAIGRLYDAATLPDTWATALDNIAALSGGMGVTVFPMEPSTAPFVYISNNIAEAAQTYFTDWLGRCPRLAYDARHPLIDRCFWDGEILDEQTLREDPYFHDYARSYDLQYSVVRTSTSVSAGSRHVISTPFSLRAGKPSDRQIQVFAILSGHAARAMALHQRLWKTTETIDRLSSLLGGRGCGIILMNSMGMILQANDLAAAMAGDAFTLHGGRLHAVQPGQQSLIDGMLAAAVDPDPLRLPAPVALRRSNGRRPLLLEAFKTGRRSGGSRPQLDLSDTGIVITVVDPDAGTPRSRREMFVLLGLTLAEARVAVLLGGGASPESVADELRLSVGTIRNHMKQIYSKLDISRQGELVALAQRLG